MQSLQESDNHDYTQNFHSQPRDRYPCSTRRLLDPYPSKRGRYLRVIIAIYFSNRGQEIRSCRTKVLHTLKRLPQQINVIHQFKKKEKKTVSIYRSGAYQAFNIKYCSRRSDSSLGCNGTCRKLLLKSSLEFLNMVL